MQCKQGTSREALEDATEKNEQRFLEFLTRLEKDQEMERANAVDSGLAEANEGKASELKEVIDILDRAAAGRQKEGPIAVAAPQSRQISAPAVPSAKPATSEEGVRSISKLTLPPTQSRQPAPAPERHAASETKRISAPRGRMQYGEDERRDSVSDSDEEDFSRSRRRSIKEESGRSVPDRVEGASPSLARTYWTAEDMRRQAPIPADNAQPEAVTDVVTTTVVHDRDPDQRIEDPYYLAAELNDDIDSGAHGEEEDKRSEVELTEDDDDDDDEYLVNIPETPEQRMHRERLVQESLRIYRRQQREVQMSLR
eukprot:scaffold260_cov274-Pinguiococcus_pyrenoidosus.AAC.17